MSPSLNGAYLECAHFQFSDIFCTNNRRLNISVEIPKFRIVFFTFSKKKEGKNYIRWWKQNESNAMNAFALSVHPLYRADKMLIPNSLTKTAQEIHRVCFTWFTKRVWILFLKRKLNFVQVVVQLAPQFKRTELFKRIQETKNSPNQSTTFKIIANNKIWKKIANSLHKFLDRVFKYIPFLKFNYKKILKIICYNNLINVFGLKSEIFGRNI